MSLALQVRSCLPCVARRPITAVKLGVLTTVILFSAPASWTPLSYGQDDRPQSAPAAPPQAADGLRTAIEQARTSLTPERLPKPDEARKRLVAQMQAFEAYLGGTQAPNAQAWFKFLSWNELLKELVSAEPNFRVLTDVEMRYRQNILGLEYAPFQAMRQAISDYIDAQRFGGNPGATIKALDAQLNRLLETTVAGDATRELERARDLGLVASYLTRSNQAPELVSLLRSQFAQPNLRVLASEQFINRAIGRPVNQPAPVNECILGTRVLGNSFVSGSLIAQLVPQQNGVSLQLCLGAQFSSNNVGYNRGVKVYTTGYSPVQASKLITLTPQGTFTQPAVASTNLQTQINGIEHRLRLVRRIASRKAEEQKPQANAIGQARLQNRLAQQFNDQIEQELRESGGNLSFLNQDRVEFVRLGLPRPAWGLRSTDSHVHADVLEADIAQFAAPGISALPNPGTGIVAELHQSLPMNVAGTVLSGRTIHSWEMDDLVRQFTGSVPAGLQEESEGEPWSLTFAEFHPVEVEFVDGLATIALRISKLTRGEQELNQPATISARYRPVIADGSIVFERQGDVQLDFVRAPSGFRAVTLRSFLKGKFDRFFRERSNPQRIVFGERMPNMPPLILDSVVFANGWAQASLR